MNQADAIRQKLREIEAANQVKILYAVESGSRAWGFASPDSDYDVRYVFIRPIKDYLRIDPLPDHIDGPLDEVQDYSGWDVKKALGLLGKSNPSLLEWLHSRLCMRRRRHGGTSRTVPMRIFRWSGICIISMRRRIAHGEISCRANRCG